MKFSGQSQRPDEIHNPEGEILQEVLGLQVGNVQSHSLAEIRIPPGGFSSQHYHQQSEESYLILSGQAELNLDGRTLPLKSGDAVLIEPSEVHQIFNRSDEDLVFLAVCVPAWRASDSFEAQGEHSK